MGLFAFLNTRKPVEKIDDAYWQRRWDESLEGKTILTRYYVAFGNGSFDDFCGVVEIKGYYDLTFADPPNTYEDGRWKDDTERFFQIDRDDTHNKYLLDPKFCFETREQAQKAYNDNVHLWVAPLKTRINALLNAVVVEGD